MKIKPVTLLLYAAGIAFFFFFLLYPLVGVFKKTFFFNDRFSADLFLVSITSPLVVRAMVNSLIVGVLTVLFSFAIALPLAVSVSGYDFPFKRLLTGVTLIPLVLPPFVGAIGMERMFGRYGLFNFLAGTTPSAWFTESGLMMTAVLEALHLFPVIYLNTVASLSNVDPRLKEAGRICGSGAGRVFRDITLPLALPGVLAGGLIVFLWSLTDVGTPLVLGVREVLAVEIFDRTSAINNDPTGPALVVLIILVTTLFMFLFKGPLSKDYGASSVKETRAADLKRPSGILLTFIYCAFALVFSLAVLPHVGIVLTSLAGDWFMSPLPAQWTGRYFGEVLTNDGVLNAARNSLLYSLASTSFDLVIGFGLAYFLVRKQVRLGWLMDALIMLPIALPGLVLAFGYLAAFSGSPLDPMKNPAPLLVIGYAVRRLPYVFRAAYAGLAQVGPQYEEAARVCGAGPVKAVTTTTLPLLWGNLLGGAILAFMFAMLEVSESLILAVKEEFYPLTRAIYYLLGKLPDGDYAAAALGVVCMVFLAGCLISVSALLGKQMGKLFRM